MESGDMTDIQFAIIATDIERQERRRKFGRGRRRAIQSLIFAAVILAALNLLFCMAFVFITLALHE